MKRKSFDGNGFCLVLSGGGAKGVYHIGVWKALQELKIGVDAFFGSSIGAIVSGYLAQGRFEALEKIGEEIGLNYIIDVPESLMEGGELRITPQTADVFRNYYRKSVKKGGLDTSPLRTILNRDLDEGAIRHSGKDLGVVTYSVTDMKSCEVYLDDMEPGTVIDYLMASSAIPGFKSPVIKGKKFIDGGVADNIPYGMARARGYRKIIVVDISGLGVVKKPDIEGTMTISIKNSINMGGILNFNKEFLFSYRDLGYLDTLKTFGILKGHEYFIEPPKDGDKLMTEVLNDSRFDSCFRKHLKVADTPADRIRGIREILPPDMRQERDLLYPFIDCAASIFNIERIRSWDYRELARTIIKLKNGEDQRLRRLREEAVKNSSKDLVVQWAAWTEAFRDISFGKESPYFYYRLGEKALKSVLPSSRKKELLKLFPKLNAGLLFLDILEAFGR